MSTYRKQRVGDLLLAFLAQEVQRFRDPRLAPVILTGLQMSADLKSARVFWALLPRIAGADETGAGEVPESEAGDPGAADPRKKEAAKALAGAEHLLKKRVAAELDLRYVPQLNFLYDETGETGSRIESLLKKAGF